MFHEKMEKTNTIDFLLNFEYFIIIIIIIIFIQLQLGWNTVAEVYNTYTANV